MKVAQIEIGKIYVNKGKGKTFRKVLAIGEEHRPTKWYSSMPPPNQPGVLYEQTGKYAGKGNLYITSFAAWARCEVKR